MMQLLVDRASAAVETYACACCEGASVVMAAGGAADDGRLRGQVQATVRAVLLQPQGRLPTDQARSSVIGMTFGRFFTLEQQSALTWSWTSGQDYIPVPHCIAWWREYGWQNDSELFHVCLQMLRLGSRSWGDQRSPLLAHTLEACMLLATGSGSPKHWCDSFQTT